jgi:ABC-type branched-subunit amino acid transport system permease subunit
MDCHRLKQPSAVITGLMGAFYAHYLGSLRPDSFNLFKTMYIQIYAILGGISFPFIGPLFGTIIMTFFPELMRVTKEIEPIITGMLLIIFMIFLPTGILSLPGLKVFFADPARFLIKIGISAKTLLLSRSGARKT